MNSGRDRLGNGAFLKGAHEIGVDCTISKIGDLIGQRRNIGISGHGREAVDQYQPIKPVRKIERKALGNKSAHAVPSEHSLRMTERVEQLG